MSTYQYLLTRFNTIPSGKGKIFKGSRSISLKQEKKKYESGAQRHKKVEERYIIFVNNLTVCH